MFLLVGAYFGIKALGDKNTENTLTAQNTGSESSQVLSETTQNPTDQGQEDEGKPSEEENKPVESDPNLEVKKGNLKIRIENGAGVGGLAARTKEFMEGFGYTVLTIDTADSKTESTILSFKKGIVSEFKDVVSADIKEKFPKIEVKEDLSEDSDYDLLIIVGTSSEL